MTGLRFIDIGANLLDGMFKGRYNDKEYHAPDLHQVLDRALSAGVDKLIITAGSLAEARAALDLARTHESLFCTVGVHPTRCGEFEAHPEGPDAYLQALLALIEEGQRDGKVVAVGECGLDYDRLHFCPAGTQRQFFKRQFALAQASKLPMFLHLRGAAQDFLEDVREHQDDFVGGVVHSFDGTEEELQRILQIEKLCIGINGCSLKTEENLAVVAQVPLTRLLLETDCPWCEIRPSHAGSRFVKTRWEAKDKKKHDPGKPVKGRNEPCCILQVLEVVAGQRGSEDVQGLAEQVYCNTFRVFFPGELQQWGLVPSFSKDAKPDYWKMFNARSESVAEKPAFRRLLPSKRCLVLVDGFYEWKKEKDGKQPYYIHLQGDEPLVFAGLFDAWHSPEGPLHTYTILTTDSSKRLSWLHDRMPVLLRDKAAQQAWLGIEDKGAKGATGLQKLLGPYDGEDLVWHPVTRSMSSISFQSPEASKELVKPSVSSFFLKKPASSPAKAAKESSMGTGMAPAAAAAGAPAAVVGVKREREEEAGVVHTNGAGKAGKAAAGSVSSRGGEAGDVKQEEGAQLGSSKAEAPPTAVNSDEQPPPGHKDQRDSVVAAGVMAGAPANSADSQGVVGNIGSDAEADLGSKGPREEGSEPASKVARRGGGSAHSSGASRPGASPTKKSPAAAGAARKGRPPGQQDISKFFKRG
ncbi:hypothetical protein N2152v2_003705 [Parachlorella kessleri]